MKAILISINPKYVAKILNGEKTIEIRKTCPSIFKHLKSYEGASLDVYIYCTKDLKSGKQALTWLNEKSLKQVKNITYEEKEILGKVVAKFTLNKVEEIFLNRNHFVNEQYSTDELDYEELLDKSCLTYRELDDYLQCEIGYAWHISNLVIFDKPKELSEFKKRNGCIDFQGYVKYLYEPLTKAPQSWQFVESEK